MNLLRKLTALFRRKELDAEMVEELQAHVELRTERNIAAGLSREEACYSARRAFGGEEQIRERCRVERGGLWLENFSKDVRHGIRLLARAPGFAFAAVVSLAIGIGANTAMFSIVDSVMLRPLPYPEAERLVTLWTENRRLGIAQQPSSFGNIVDWQKAARTLDGIAVHDPASVILTSVEARRVSALFATPNLAEVLRVSPALGRMFTAEEATHRESVAVLSHEAWQQHHAGRADILGQRIEVDGRPTVIIGVMPPRVNFPDKDTQLWIPHTLTAGWDAAQFGRGAGPWRVVARLAPGASLADAHRELAGVASALRREEPLNAGLDVRVVPLAENVIGRDLRSALVLLLAAVGAVLLIACSNVGNLLLARGLTRQREFALRLSLGATRGRLVVQLLIENLVLCLLAAAIGLGLAWLALEAVRAFAPANIPRIGEVTLDLRMLAFAVGLSLASACGLGLLPALQSTRRDALAMLRTGGRGATEAPRTRRLRSALVVAEFALAVVLFAGAGVLLRSFVQLLAVDPGFRLDNVLVVGMRLSAHRPPHDAIPFANAVVERVAALPGVRVAAVGTEVLLGERGQQALSAERPDTGEITVARMSLGNDSITPDYFRALGVALREGRFFDAFDGADAPPVVIVNATLARQLWPDGRAVGRRLRTGGLDSRAPWATVVGVVGDQRRQKLDRAPIPQLFSPLAQQPARGMILVVRTAGEPAPLLASVRRAVQAIDATVPVGEGDTLRRQVERTVAPRRFHTGLLTGFAAIALVLAGVGIFGLMHYSVARRTQEIGVRTALGASGGQILRQILREGLTVAALGVVIGFAGAVALLRFFSTLLFEVRPTDPWSLGTAAVVMIAMAALACWLPARRAAKIDPMAALRTE